MRSARRLIWTCLFVLGVAQLGAVQKETPPKYIPRFQVQLPIEPNRASFAVMGWARHAGVPIIVEDMALPPPPRPSIQSIASPPSPSAGRVINLLDLTGMEVNAALLKLMEYLPQYRMTKYGDLVVFRLRDCTVLDRKVDHFILNAASYIEAIQSIRQIYDPSWVAPDRPMQPRPDGSTDFYNVRFTGSISVDMSDVTVEQILSEIARKLPGGATWIIQYAPPDMDIMRATITLLQPDGTQVSVGWNPKGGAIRQ